MNGHIAEPAVIDRAAQPYVGIARTVTMQTIDEVADRFPEIFGWLAERGINPTGAPFLRYHVIDMERGLRIEAGVPVAELVDSYDMGDIATAVLPAGRYAVATHHGHPEQLVDAIAALLAWAQDNGLEWDMSATGDGEHWASRLETNYTNPAEERDLTKWETELAFKLAD